MFTRDVITAVHEQIGPGQYTFAPAGDNYVVGINLQQSGTSGDTLIQCGTTTMARDYGRDTANNILNYHCTSAITLTKNGGSSVFAIVSYIPTNQFTNTMIASVSGEINLARGTAYSFGYSTYVMWFGMGLIILLLAIETGLKLFEQ